MPWIKYQKLISNKTFKLLLEPYSYFRQSKRHLVEVQYLSLQTDDPLMLMHLVSSIILDLVLLQEDFPENSVSSTHSAPALSMLLAGCPRKIWEETNLLEGWLSLLEIFNLQVPSTSCSFSHDNASNSLSALSKEIGNQFLYILWFKTENEEKHFLFPSDRRIIWKTQIISLSFNKLRCPETGLLTVKCWDNALGDIITLILILSPFSGISYNYLT